MSDYGYAYDYGRQQKERKEKSLRTGMVIVVIIMLLALLIMFTRCGQRGDDRLVGTWRQKEFPYTTWVITSDDRVAMSVSDGSEIIDGGRTKYRAVDGEIRLWENTRFETIYTYQFGTATDESGNVYEVLILNGGDLILFKAD